MRNKRQEQNPKNMHGGTPLPLRVLTYGKASFDPHTDVWSYRENTLNVSINFAVLQVDKNILPSLKAVFVWYAQNRSAAYTKNLFVRFSHFFQFLKRHHDGVIQELRVVDVLNYKTSLPPENLWYLRPVGILLRKWFALGHPGVGEDVVGLLEELQLPSNPKGIAVLTMDPVNGPFSDLEVEAIQSALNTAYSEARISQRHFVLVWLFLLLGQRPTQYANLRVCDFLVHTGADGTTAYLLQVPRAKQQNGSSRSSFTTRALLPQFGLMLQSYVEGIRQEFSEKLKDSNQAPLFPKSRSTRAPEGFEYHSTSGELGSELTGVLGQLRIPSERTGNLKVSATRFRRTLGTRAAAEGHGELVIAELLDHSDTSNAGVYVHATPAIVERIDRAIAMQLAPLAQAFAGVLIRDESEAERGNDPRSRITDPRLGKSTQPMGTCGKHGFCGFAAPIACYTCTNFQPWLDGPHEAVLARLIDERERLMHDTDVRIAAINDRTILAVAEVVRRCEAAHAMSVEGTHG